MRRRGLVKSCGTESGRVNTTTLNTAIAAAISVEVLFVHVGLAAAIAVCTSQAWEPPSSDPAACVSVMVKPPLMELTVPALVVMPAITSEFANPGVTDPVASVADAPDEAPVSMLNGLEELADHALTVIDGKQPIGPLYVTVWLDPTDAGLDQAIVQRARVVVWYEVSTFHELVLLSAMVPSADAPKSWITATIRSAVAVFIRPLVTLRSSSDDAPE